MLQTIYYKREQLEANCDITNHYVFSKDLKDNEGCKGFIAYHKQTDIEIMKQALDENNNLYEVIYPTSIIKPYFDLEIETEEENHRSMGLLFIDTTIRYIADKYGVELEMEDFAVFDSCRTGKLSYHLLIQQKICFENMASHSIFAKGLFEYIKNTEPSLVWGEKKQKTIMDVLPYGNHQNFRMPNQSKKGKTHILKNVSKLPIMDWFVTLQEKGDREIVKVIKTENKKEEKKIVVIDKKEQEKWVKILMDVIKNESINDKRLIGRGQWFLICGILKTNGFQKKVWLDWSGLSSKTDTAEKTWNTLFPKELFSVGGLVNIAKSVNQKGYAKWRGVFETSPICDSIMADTIKSMLKMFDPKGKNRICFTDAVFGELFEGLYGKKFVFCKGLIYNFNGIYWEADNKHHTNIQNFINTTFIKDVKRWIEHKISVCFGNKKDDSDTETDDTSKNDKELVFWSKLNMCITEYLQQQKATEQLIKMVCSKICNDSQKWDLNPYIFVFKNCVFDLKKGEKCDANPMDFMTTCCGWDYDDDYKCDDVLTKLIASIQTDKNVRDYLLKAYSTGMVGIQNRNVFIFTGTGGNGKSVLDELLFAMLGNYSYTLPKDFLTQPFKEGANPAVMLLHNKRAVLVSEPDANKNIVCSSLKAMSGDSKISSRGLYCDVDTINITATNFIECNTAPELDEMNDAMTDRLGEGVINFHSKFVKKTVWDSATDEERASWAGIQDIYYKSDEFKNIYRQCLFNTLLPYIEKDVPTPSSVVIDSSRYLTKSDPLYPLLLECYDKVEGSVVKIKDFHNKLVCVNGSSWTKQQKEKYGSIRKFEEAIRNNVFLKKYVKDRKEYYGDKQLSSLSICGWKEKEEELEEE
jgi:phage/plasmid-associated DNA primase